MASIDKLIMAFRNIRDTLSEERKIWEARENDLKEKMELLKAQMLVLLDKSGAENISTKKGLVYKKKVQRVKMCDPDTFYNYVHKEHAYHLFEKRVSKKNALELIDDLTEEYSEKDEEFDPGSIGISVEIEYDVGVNKPSASMVNK